MLLLAEYFMKTQKAYDSVLFYSEEPIVVKQLKLKSIYFEENRKFILTNDWNPDKWLRENNKAFFIFDEAEQLLEKRLLSITERGL